MSDEKKDFEEHGASCFMSQENYDHYVASGEYEALGRPNENGDNCQFVIPSNEADALVENTGGDPAKMETALGLDEGSLGDSPTRVDIDNPQEYGLREAKSGDPGVNDKFTGTGETPGGQHEAIVENVPTSSVSAAPVKAQENAQEEDNSLEQ